MPFAWRRTTTTAGRWAPNPAATPEPQPTLTPQQTLSAIRFQFRTHRPPPPYVTYTESRSQKDDHGFIDYVGSYTVHYWCRTLDRAALKRRVYRANYRGPCDSPRASSGSNRKIARTEGVRHPRNAAHPGGFARRVLVGLALAEVELRVVDDDLVAEARGALNELAASMDFSTHRPEFDRAQKKLDEAGTLHAIQELAHIALRNKQRIREFLLRHARCRPHMCQNVKLCHAQSVTTHLIFGSALDLVTHASESQPHKDRGAANTSAPRELLLSRINCHT